MENIAIFRRNGLGDLLTTYPLISYLKKIYPSSSVTLFLEESNYSIIRFLPLVDEIVVTSKRGNKYYSLLKEVLLRRKRKFDIAISAKSSPMKLMNFALYATGAKERYAYIDQSWHGRLVNKGSLYDHERAQKMHQALKCLHLFAPELKEVPEEHYPKIVLPNSLSTPYTSYFDPREPTIFLSATTSRNENCFDGERYAEIINRLAKKRPLRVCLVSMAESELRAHFIAGHLKVPYRLWFTETFEEFMALLHLSDMVFVGDGGVAHIAAALNKPQVVLFGETHPRNWHPLSKQTTALYHPLHVNLLSDQKIYDELEHKLCKI